MTFTLATPCKNCSHPLNVHDNAGDQRVVRTCIACSCENYEPDSCYWGHTSYCEHQDEYEKAAERVIKEAKKPVWETKDSGARAEFESGMVRDTADGKARFELLLPLGVPYRDQFLVRVAELMARGAEKYEDRNWEKARGDEELERFKSSAIRHLMQWAAGEGSEDHAAAVVFNLLGYETTMYKRGER